MTADKTIFGIMLARARERQEALDFLRQLRLDAQARKRAYGNPRNPRAALPGYEKDFLEAAQTSRYLGIILNEIDKSSARERRKKAAASVASRALDILIGVGLVSTGIFGPAAMCIVLGLNRYIAWAALGVGLYVTVAILASLSHKRRAGK